MNGIAMYPGAAGGPRELDALDALGRRPGPRDERQIRQVATQLSSTLFFQPLLQEMRRSQLGARFAHGGRGEEVFAEQLDLRIADAVAAADAGGMTGRIAEALRRTKAARAAAAEVDRPVSWIAAVQAAAQRDREGS